MRAYYLLCSPCDTHDTRDTRYTGYTGGVVGGEREYKREGLGLGLNFTPLPFTFFC
jgi:hypothetical protein